MQSDGRARNATHRALPFRFTVRCGTPSGRSNCPAAVVNMAMNAIPQMNTVPQLFQAFVAPAIFVSAEGLLLLSLNVRLMGIVSRLRSYLHERHHAIRQGRLVEADAYASQIASIERRAEIIRRAFTMTLYGLVGTIAACLLLGAGLYWRLAQGAAAIIFVLAIVSLLGGTVYYAQEVQVALSSVREEAADSRFMDLLDRADALEAEEVVRGM